ncbi:MAG: phosphoribosylanthranilate isomerase [Pelagibacterales bacterium]|nr:phosphoribosylanthranilate isomerase [Pelagibacterales bacterium]
MIKGSKICGISDSKTLNYIINHQYPPQFIGIICNYSKSKRYVQFDKLVKLIDVDKKNISFVAVLVSPNDLFLEKIKNLNFDYYQLYDVSPEKTQKIKKKYNKKIITSLTIENKKDVEKYKDYQLYSEIINFDSKGYEHSIGFDHELLQDIPSSINKMIAGNIKIEDIPNFKNTSYIIDVSSALENEKGVKDINKIDKFLNSVHNN